jgi:hypothetical protein
MPALDPDKLADAMEAALPQAWSDAKGVPFPGGDPKDRRPLFLAISRALVTYVASNQGSIIQQMDLSVGGAAPVANKVSNLILNL